VLKSQKGTNSDIGWWVVQRQTVAAVRVC